MLRTHDTAVNLSLLHDIYVGTTYVENTEFQAFNANWFPHIYLQESTIAFFDIVIRYKP